MVFVRKNLILIRQIRTTGINQIDAGKVVLQRNLLLPVCERARAARRLALSLEEGCVFSPSASCFFFKRWARCFMFTVDGVWQSTVGLMLARRSRGSLCTYRSRCGTERAEETR